MMDWPTRCTRLDHRARKIECEVRYVGIGDRAGGWVGAAIGINPDPPEYLSSLGPDTEPPQNTT